MKIFLSVLLFSFQFLVFSQKESSVIQFKSVYEIDYEGFQKVILKQTIDNKYEGYFVNHTTKFPSRLSRKFGAKSKKISDTRVLNTDLTQKLILKLDSIGITSINKINCYSIISRKGGTSKEKIDDFYNCEKHTVNCLDGDHTYFKIIIDNSVKKFNFNCLCVNEKIRPRITEDRIKAIKIINILDEYLNFKKSFSGFISKLKRGRYSYYGPASLRIK